MPARHETPGVTGPSGEFVTLARLLERPRVLQSSGLLDARLLNLLLASIVMLAGVRFWLMPLTSSFWVDEMGTVFVVHHGAGDESLKVAPQVADSVYYALPRIAEKMFGMSEAAY